MRREAVEIKTDQISRLNHQMEPTHFKPLLILRLVFYAVLFVTNMLELLHPTFLRDLFVCTFRSPNSSEVARVNL